MEKVGLEGASAHFYGYWKTTDDACSALHDRKSNVDIIKKRVRAEIEIKYSFVATEIYVFCEGPTRRHVHIFSKIVGYYATVKRARRNIARVHDNDEDTVIFVDGIQPFSQCMGLDNE